MIPKIIHYCWYGGGPLFELNERCIASWYKYLPDYEIICWNESNSPMNVGYMKNAFKKKKWANLSNYMRFHALYEHGGIYFDTDVEVIKSFNPLLSETCFAGFEKNNPGEWISCINNAVLGSVPGHPPIKRLRSLIQKKYTGTEPANYSSPFLMSSYLFSKGLKEYGDQVIDSIHLYPLEYFYPYAYNETFDPSCVKPETYCIHHWQYLWREDK